jgi:2-methylisocitrate lyase-like PEP mutase family enzyme
MTGFAELHHRPTPLLLPNAWDVPTVLGFVDAGYPAIGTTSFGIAASLGHPDAGRLTRDATLALVRAVAGIPTHLSVDVEDGYADDPGEVADHIAELAAAGAVGINLEDSSNEALIDPGVAAAKITAVKQAVPDVFVNARIDTYWLDQHDTPADTLERAARYVDAGADGVFVPGTADADVIAELAATIPVPLNVLAAPGRSLDELAELGVRRVSTGSLPYRAALRTALDAVAAIRDVAVVPAALPYADLQARLAAFHEGTRVR